MVMVMMMMMMMMISRINLGGEQKQLLPHLFG